MKTNELELTRRGCTPAQFAAYVRHMIKKHGIDSVDIDFDYWKRGGDLEFDYHDDPSRPCKAERSVSKPYQMQTYIRNWDGTVYNLIMEFDHWNERTGIGYFYFLNTIDGTTTDTNTTENEKENDPMTTTNTNHTIDTVFVLADTTIVTRPYATRSAWNRGVTAYAVELLEGLKEGVEGGWIDLDDLRSRNLAEKAMLNGASDWSQYSWGGCSLCYNGQIAERLCTKSELNVTRNGQRRPNAREEWLDVQTRALHQAAKIVSKALLAVFLNM